MKKTILSALAFGLAGMLHAQTIDLGKIGGALKNKVKANPKAAETSNKPTAETAAKTTTTTGRELNPNRFYTITTTVAGEELALTFIVPPGKVYNYLLVNPSEAKIELKKLTKDSTQIWHFPAPYMQGPEDYLIYTKVGISKGSGGVMKIVNQDSSYNDNGKYNRLTVGLAHSEYNENWIIKKLDNGSFRIMSFLAYKSSLNNPNDGVDRYRQDKWNEERSLEAVEVDGKVTLQHKRTADTPGQYWKITSTGYVPW